jgi:ABC-type proline/glycine betaine transport system permease subunit
VSMYVYSSIVARQGLGKNVTVAINTHTTIEELLGVYFSMRSVSYRRKVGD